MSPIFIIYTIVPCFACLPVT